MLHGVAGGGLALDLLVEHLELLGRRRELLGRTPQRQQARIEQGHVGLEHLGRVALRIDGDEDALHLVAVSAQLGLDLRQLHQRRGAHVGALREAKEHHHQPTTKVLELAHLTQVVGQLKTLGVLGTRDVDGFKRQLALAAAGQSAGHDNDGSHMQNKSALHGAGFHSR